MSDAAIIPWYKHSVARWVAFIPCFFIGHYLGRFLGGLAPRFLLPFNPLTPEYLGYMILNIIPWVLSGLLATIFAMRVAPKELPGMFALAIIVSFLTLAFAISAVDQYGHLSFSGIILVAIPVISYAIATFVAVLYRMYDV